MKENRNGFSFTVISSKYDVKHDMATHEKLFSFPTLSGMYFVCITRGENQLQFNFTSLY